MLNCRGAIEEERQLDHRSQFELKVSHPGVVNQRQEGEGFICSTSFLCCLSVVHAVDCTTEEEPGRATQLRCSISLIQKCCWFV